MFYFLASESVHHAFDLLWTNGSFKRDLSHEDYELKLLQCSNLFNSQRALNK